MGTKIGLLLITGWFLGVAVGAQPGTEVVLMDLHLSPDSVAVSNQRNISNRKGYDNQPHFSNTGKALLYSSQRGNQTEVIQYELMSGKTLKITNSAGSEYSPTTTPDGSHFSTIVLESSGRQLLWQYNSDGGEASVLVPDLKIGYHCWLGPQLLAAFVLGEPTTLHLCDLNSGMNKIIASNIGRSLHKIPGTTDLSFINKTSDPWSITTYRLATGTFEPLVACLSQSEDMAWTPDGSILMGQGSKLYLWNPSRSENWLLIADLSTLGLRDITRLAVNTEGTLLALVVADPIKP